MKAPPFTLVNRIYREARAACRIKWGRSVYGIEPGTTALDETARVVALAWWHRKVQREFHRRLKAAGIHVEGA